MSDAHLFQPPRETRRDYFHRRLGVAIETRLAVALTELQDRVRGEVMDDVTFDARALIDEIEHEAFERGRRQGQQEAFKAQVAAKAEREGRAP